MRPPATPRKRPSRTVMLGAGGSDRAEMPDRVSGATPVLSALSERVFQAHVVAGLRQRGWLVYVVPDMRRTARGLPDLVCVKPGRLLLLELKTARGRVRPEQQQVMNCLAGAPTVLARVVRPADWETLKDEV